MTEIQQNRWDQLVRRAANIVGGGSQVNDTLNELFPVIDVERVPGELLFLSGMRLGMCSSRLLASAAENNHHQLFNPVGSGMLVVITQMLVGAVTAQRMRAAVVSGALVDAVGNEVLRDTRLGVGAAPVAQNRSDQSAGGLGAIMEFFVEQNKTLSLEDQNGLFVLFPGTGVQCTTTIVNTQTLVGWWWRERVFEPAEENF